MRRKTLPAHERAAIAAEIVQLLSQIDALGRRRWTTVTLGHACGGLTHETIRLARTPAGVGPSVREAICAFTGLTIQQLMQKHGVAPSTDGASFGGSHATFQSVTPSGIAVTSLTTPSGFMPIPDRIALAKSVIAALEQDGVERATAQQAVSAVVFEQEFSSELDLYRKARFILEAGAASEAVASVGRAAGRGQKVNRRG